tara:strand:- start:15949 stop:17106 length:1158 start_codon:yes stop_codon:yes gene_type:complete
MTDKKIDLSSLSNFDLGPNWETTPVKGNKEFKQTKKKRKSYLKTNDKRAIAKPIFDINITYDHSVISKIKDKIRKSGITYSVEEIANTIISTKERLSFKVEKQNKETFFEVIFDNSIFSSRDKAINHVIQNGLDSLVKVTSIEEESTTGKYDSILKCPISKKLLPPKNYHNFESCVYQHLYENKIVRKYEDFVNNLENITELEVIESWKKTPIKKFTYQFKNKLGKEKKFESINLITKEIENSFVNFVREKNKIVISGIEIDKLDKLLMNEIKEFFDKNHKWKKDLFFNIIINLKKSGFHIFKTGKQKNMYACPVKPKKFDEEKLSESCFNIIQVIKQSTKISKKDLINTNFKKTISKDSILYELKWLLKEGYIKEFKDGQISIN